MAEAETLGEDLTPLHFILRPEFRPEQGVGRFKKRIVRPPNAGEIETRQVKRGGFLIARSEVARGDGP